MEFNMVLMTIADLVTERERHLTTRKLAEKTKLEFRCPICHSAIGKASCLFASAVVN